MPSFLTQKGVNNIKNKIESAFVKRAWLGMASSEDGTIIGVATLDRAGLIPSTQLPSYVDDTIEAYFNGTNFYSDSAFTKKINGETGKIYVNIANNEYSNRTYRWSGSQYIEISKQLALGRDAYSAFRGDWGATLEGYFSNGKAKQAIADENGNNIVSTYMPYRGGTFTGDVTHAANLILTNSKVIVGKDTNGSNVSLLSINTSNQVVIGYGAHNKYDTLLYGNRLIAYGDICGQKGVSAKGIADFGVGSSSGGNGGAHYDLLIDQKTDRVTLQLKGDDGDIDTKDMLAFSTSRAGIVAKAPSAGSVLRGNGWGTLAFGELASKPTTLGGYGITDAYTKTQIANGVFPNMRVGLADDLGDIEETLDEEYTFQPTANPNEIRDGYAQIESLKGNSLVWNQLMNLLEISGFNGTATKKTTNGFVYTAPASSLDKSIVSNQVFRNTAHIYLLRFDYTSNLPFSVQNQIGSRGLSAASVFTKYTVIGKMESYAHSLVYWYLYSTTTEVWNLEVRNCIAIDLTQMFGEGYEPETVEEFEKRCPKGMSMDYNEGEVIHFNGDLKSVGFNQWDEEWVNGYYRIDGASGAGNDGTFVNDPSYIANAKPMKVMPNTQYSVKSPYILLFGECDIDGNYTGNRYYVDSGGTFTTSPNCYFVLFYMDREITNATYNHDICINISDPDKNGTYEPYTEFRRDLPTELFEGGMKGYGTAYDEVYWDKAKRTNVKVQRFGKVDLGSLSWRYQGSPNNVWNAIIEDAVKSNSHNIICHKYTTQRTTTDKTIELVYSFYTANKTSVLIADSAYTDAATFKAAVSGVMLYYELAEPIVEEIDIPYMDYQVSNSGTEEIVSDVPTTPFKGRVTYNFDTIGTVKQNRFDISALKIDLKSNYQPLATAINTSNIGSQSVARAIADGDGNVIKDTYLKLSGGTIEATGTRTLTINRNNGNNSLIFFKGVVNGSSNDLGYLGFNGINSPIFYSVEGNTHSLLHAGNTSLTLEKTGTDVTGFNLEVNDVEVGFSEITDAEINEIFSSWNV